MLGNRIETIVDARSAVLLLPNDHREVHVAAYEAFTLGRGTGDGLLARYRLELLLGPVLPELPLQIPVTAERRVALPQLFVGLDGSRPELADGTSEVERRLFACLEVLKHTESKLGDCRTKCGNLVR